MLCTRLGGGNKAAQRKDVACIAALNISSLDTSQQPCTLLPIISHDELVRTHQEDPTIGEVVRLKETSAIPTDVTRKAAKILTRKILRE